MGLKEKLRSDMAVAMRSGDSDSRDAIRMLLAAIKQVEVDTRSLLDDAGVLAVLAKQAKQRSESIADFEKAGRTEAAASERIELDVIRSYLPQMMSREQVSEAALAVIVELGIKEIKGMGAVMSRLMPVLRGRADGQMVSDVVRELLHRGL